MTKPARRILITSALPYINGVKHLGNLVGSMLPADVYARYARAKGAEVLAVCATDEHGTPAELAAAAKGMEVSAFCDEAHALQKSLGERFGLSWDWFGRTSRLPNHELTRRFARLLEDAGLIEEREDEQVYSPTDGRFLPDRYVEGTCPQCGFERARGDQCDNCGSLLDPTDLKDPRSAISGATDLEVRKTRHLYLRQSAMTEELRAWIGAKTGWSRLVTSIAFKWLDDGDGLQDRSITRDLSWGVRVPPAGSSQDDVDAVRPGYEDKVFYVWFDAPIGYIAATREWAEGTEGLAEDAWRRWWRVGEGAEDVAYVQFMAKDNIPFHTVGFPVTLLGAEKAGEHWKSADYIKGFNWLTWYGGKFSTSEKRGVFMDQALELLPADYWRWWLIANAPEGDDTSFTWERFQEQCNKDLADVLGNFVNRVCRFTASKFGETVPEGGDESALFEGADNWAARLSERIACYENAMSAMRFRQAAGELRAIWALANEFVTEAAPWTAFKTDPGQAAAAVRVCFNLIRIIGVLSAPFIPETAARLLAILGIDTRYRRGGEERDPLADWVGAKAEIFDVGLEQGGVGTGCALDPGAMREELRRIEGGRPFTPPPVLFKKIEDADVAAWRERFGGE